MFSSKSLASATALLSLIASSSAKYDAFSNANVALYWGQGANQETLAAFCTEDTVDIIPIGFVNTFNAQANGWAGDNYGNGCWAGPSYPMYNAPGYDGVDNDNDNLLHSRCPYVQEGAAYCQELGKKILLSLGGAYVDGSGYPKYGLTGATDGIAFAEFLWGAYGPYTDAWFNAGKPRPLDRGLYNTSAQHVDVDGFDFDIELTSSDNGAGYIACINHLRYLMNRDNPSKKYLITGAPQCFLPDENMSEIIQGVAFDILWIQFYNNPSCSAGNSAGFNFKEWIKPTNLGLSSDAKLYVGLQGSSVGLTFTEDYLTPEVAQGLINTITSNSTLAPHLGGVMIWEATSALNNVGPSNTTYYEAIKSCLLDSASISSSSTVSSTTTSSSSSSSTSVVTTSSSSSSSSSVSVSPTSTSATATPTSCPPKSLGCYTESGAEVPHRTLDGASFPDFSTLGGQTLEECAQSCVGFTYFGVEYGGECYCGNEILFPAVPAPDADCNIACLGNPLETCGGSNRLNIYQYDTCSGTSTSASVSSTSSTVSSTSSTSSQSSTVTSDSSTSTSDYSTSTTSSSSSSSSSTSSDSSTSTSDYSTSTTSSSSSSVTSASSTSSDSSTSTSDYSTSTTSSSSSSVTSASSTSSGSSTSTSGYPTSTISSDSSSVTSSSSTSSIFSTSSDSSLSTSGYPTGTAGGNSSTSSVSSTSSSATEISSSSTLSLDSSTSTSGSLSSSTSSFATFTPPYGNSTLTSSTSSTTPTGTSSGLTTASSTSLGSTDSSSTYPSSSSTYLSSSSTQSPISSHGGDVTSSYPSGPSSGSISEYTTSTVYTTKVITETSCAPTVTNCPAGPHEVTVTIPLYTTICPVTATETSPPAGPSSNPGGAETVPYTTSTVYTTHVYTVTSCAPTITNCPVGQVTTEIISLYTTVCPVAGETGTPVSVPIPPFSGVPSSLPAGNLESTSTRSSTTTSYITVKVIQSTATVIPTPKYPTPVKEFSSAVGTGAGVPSGYTYTPIYSKPTSAAGAVYTAPPGAAASTPASFTPANAGTKMSFSGLAVVAAMVLALVI